MQQCISAKKKRLHCTRDTQCHRSCTLIRQNRQDKETERTNVTAANKLPSRSRALIWGSRDLPTELRQGEEAARYRAKLMKSCLTGQSGPGWQKFREGLEVTSFGSNQLESLTSINDNPKEMYSLKELL